MCRLIILYSTATNEYGSTAETEAALNGAEVKIRELLYPAEGANKRETGFVGSLLSLLFVV